MMAAQYLQVCAACLLRKRADALAVILFAGVAELADALASGASVRKDVWVQVPPSASLKLANAGFFFFPSCRQPMSQLTRVTQGMLVCVPENVLKTA